MSSPCLSLPNTRTEAKARAELNRPAQIAPLFIAECEFWMVWTKNGRVPNHIHHTHLDAEHEADRLARLHPGRKFMVLRAYRKVHVAAVTP